MVQKNQCRERENDSFVSREREDRAAIRKEDFILDKLKDQTIYRLPGSVNGQQFISTFTSSISLNSNLFEFQFKIAM